MSDERTSPTPIGSRAGLCEQCRHAALQTSARGSSFLRCGRSDDDPRFSRYPPLPVSVCPGFESADAEGG